MNDPKESYASLHFSDIIGQSDALRRLKAYLELMRSKGRVPGPILITGNDGSGKETISRAFANEMAVNFSALNSSEIEKQPDLTAPLSNMKSDQVFLITDLHRLPRELVPQLARSLRKLEWPITIGKGPAAREFILGIKPYTFIATCPRRSDCQPNLLDEFSLVLDLAPYSPEEAIDLADIIGQKYSLELTQDARQIIIRNCELLPGGLDSMLSRIGRFLGEGIVTKEEVVQALTSFGFRVKHEGKTEIGDSPQDLSGVDFEKLIARLLLKMEFVTEMTKTSGDGGIDIIAHLDKPIVGGRYLFQCKCYSTSFIGAPTVRDFCGAVTTDHAVKGVLITTSNFTLQARQFAEKAGIELIDGSGLNKLLLDAGLINSDNQLLSS